MVKRFKYVETSIAGLFRIERNSIGDSRGYFTRFFCRREFDNLGFTMPIEQMNHTLTTKKGTVRGLHYQKTPHCEIKLVSCLVGEIWDVVVDLRYNSPSFLQWHAERLSAENQAALYIPKGCAHGFQTLTDNCQLFYLHSDSYYSDAEAGINPTDTKLCISWPLGISEISERDKNHPLLDNNFTGINIR